MSRASRLLRTGTFVFKADAFPGRADVRRCRMKAELAGIGCRSKVAGEQSNSDRDPATELLRSGGYIDKVSDDLHLHHSGHIHRVCRKVARGRKLRSKNRLRRFLGSARKGDRCHLCPSGSEPRSTQVFCHQ